MNRCWHVWTGFLAVGVWWFAAVGYAQTPPPPPSPSPPPPSAEGTGQNGNGDVEVMTRGPVHEAYAEPVARAEGAPVVVTKKPPDAIEELPPDTKPEGDHVAWISGYWAWDDDRKDFLWVSGVWRAVPANQTWVPGYWMEADGGYRWVSGFWRSQQTDEVEYLAEPPATMEQGPTSAAPSDNYFWSPGYWRWYETRYVWRPGFWTVCQPDWIWVPARYCWTPRGWVFIDGYWDYPLVRRGVLFAPIVFRRPPLHWRHFHWSPAIVIEPAILNFHLFVRPSYGHYYFGDYYAVGYEAMGFRPWFYYHGRQGFDPLFNYYRWYLAHHAHDRDWERNIHGWFTYYRHNEHERPPHTLLAQQHLPDKAKGRPDFQHLQIGQPLKELAKRPNSFVKMAAISDVQRNKIKDASRQFDDFKKQRLEIESSHRGQPGPKFDAKLGVMTKQPDKVRLPQKIDLGGLGAGPSHGPTLTGPTTGPKMGVIGPTTGPKTGVIGPTTGPKTGTTGPATGIGPKTGVIGPTTGPKPGVTVPTTGPKPGVTVPTTGPKPSTITPPSGTHKSTDTPPGSGATKPLQPGGSSPAPTIHRDPGRGSSVPKSSSAGTSDMGGASGVRRSGGGSPPPTFRESSPTITKQSSGSGASTGAGRSTRGPDRDDRDKDRDRDKRDRR